MNDPAGPARSRRPLRWLAAAGALVMASLAVGCGSGDDVVALAVERPEWVTAPVGADGLGLRVDTECADLTEATVEPTAGVDGLPLVTVWGQPRMGRCRTQVVLAVPAGTTRIEDAATGMVVDLPVR